MGWAGIHLLVIIQAQDSTSHDNELPGVLGMAVKTKKNVRIPIGEHWLDPRTVTEEIVAIWP